MSCYYNENNPFAAEWLRNLIDAGLIAPGVVDSRSIVDVTADDVREFTQCHFFAGIGVWSYACRLAGIPDDYPIWTGSCPCQPFSAAGKQRGTADERHLWPELYRLIRECRPAAVVGEQVEAAVRHGWLDGVFTDLEGEGYACGAAVLGAHSVGAPHIRQRLWWVANSDQSRRLPGSGERCRAHCSRREHGNHAQRCGRNGGLSDSRQLASRRDETREGAEASHEPPDWRPETVGKSGRHRGSHGLRDAIYARLEGHTGHGDGRDQPGRIAAIEDRSVATPGGVDPWSEFVAVACLDGKTRRLEPGLEPLVDGPAFRLADGRSRSDTSRREILHAIGNAIVPQVAAEFLLAALP